MISWTISRLIADRNIEHTDLLQREDLCGQGKCKLEILHDKIKRGFYHPFLQSFFEHFFLFLFVINISYFDFRILKCRTTNVASVPMQTYTILQPLVENRSQFPVADTGFPWGGCQSWRGAPTYYLANSNENGEILGCGGGGACIPHAPLDLRLVSFV